VTWESSGPVEPRLVRARFAEALHHVPARASAVPRAVPYAVIDTARSSRALALVRECGPEALILYEGEVEPEIAEVAPYLVPAGPSSPAAKALCDVGWGGSWGICCATTASADLLRRHLRRFLTALTEDGRKLLFRFYDPRVLRVYLPTCTPGELDAFFGPLERVVLEGEAGASLVVYRRDSAGFAGFALEEHSVRGDPTEPSRIH
jgi:hypothetical protein